MGKSFRHKNKWYDQTDDDESYKKNKFKDRRKKKLRKIVDRDDSMSDNDRFEGERSGPQ